MLLKTDGRLRGRFGCIDHSHDDAVVVGFIPGFCGVSRSKAGVEPHDCRLPPLRVTPGPRPSRKNRLPAPCAEGYGAHEITHAMTRLLPSSFLFALALLAHVAASAALPTNADAPELGIAVGTIPVPADLDADEVRDVVVLSVATRGWTVQTKTDERVVGYLKHRGNEATITYLLGPDLIRVHCVGYAINKSGERRKPELPQSWINNLQRDITKRLNVAAATK